MLERSVQPAVANRRDASANGLEPAGNGWIYFGDRHDFPGCANGAPLAISYAKPMDSETRLIAKLNPTDICVFAAQFPIAAGEVFADASSANQSNSLQTKNWYQAKHSSRSVLAVSFVVTRTYWRSTCLGVLSLNKFRTSTWHNPGEKQTSHRTVIPRLSEHLKVTTTLPACW